MTSTATNARVAVNDNDEFSLLKLCPPPRNLTDALGDLMIKTGTDDPYFRVLWNIFNRLSELDQKRVIRRLEIDSFNARKVHV